jgi:hypothetical protein
MKNHLDNILKIKKSSRFVAEDAKTLLLFLKPQRLEF